MQWEKCGLLWIPSGDLPWARTHASVPVVHCPEPGLWYVYVSTRDAQGKSRIGRLVVDVADGGPRVREFCPQPVLDLGAPGTFDDSGAMSGWIVDDGDVVRLYYIGWNVAGTVPYRVSIGLATSRDNGHTFTRYSEGPVVDRSAQEPYFATGPCVHRIGAEWRLWYASCTGWILVDGRWEPRYHVKTASSHDGYAWTITGHSCVTAGDDGAIGRPCVFRRGAGYGMLYSSRSLRAYREDPDQAYRLGYAESHDGLAWTRRDDQVGIARSASGWDSEMLCYSWVQRDAESTYLLYNGNGFGRSGVGLARLTAEE